MIATPKGVSMIDIGGKERPFKFGVNASIMLQDGYGYKFSEMENAGGDLGMIRAIIACGLKDGANKCKEPFDSAIETVGEWIDDYIVDHGMTGLTDIIQSGMVFKADSKGEGIAQEITPSNGQILNDSLSKPELSTTSS